MQLEISRTLKRVLASFAAVAFAATGFSQAASPETPAPIPTAAPTFNKDIAPIVFEHCAGCHRPGEVAPFSLLTFNDVKKHSSEIGELTHNRQMPPWKPTHGFGEFLGERRLSDQQIETIQNWIKAGRQEGNAADLPPAPKFVEGWTLGEPDLVVKMPKAFTLRAEGRDIQRCFAVPLSLPEDKYVEAVEFRPSNRKIVHHALLYLDANHHARELDGVDGQPGFGKGGGLGFLPTGGMGGWAPGVTPKRLPDNAARYMKAGSDIVIQLHLHSSGKEETEQSSIGLYFAKKTPDKLFMSHMRGLTPRDFSIAAGQSNYERTASFTVPANVKLLGVFPHAHLLCKEIEVTATFPDGKSMPVIWIKDWDWDWQDEYLYPHAIDVPKGTQVHMRFRFDNSDQNVKNPSKPPKPVHWGEQTADEMALCFFQILVDRADAPTIRGANQKERLKRWMEAVQRQAADKNQ